MLFLISMQCSQQAKKLCRDIMKAVDQLQEKRDMSINECKLTIAIEDPRSRERREAMGIEVRPLGRCCVMIQL